MSEIARQPSMDRKTVRKYLREAPRKDERQPEGLKGGPVGAYLRERWEQGVANAARIFDGIQKRGYAGGASQVRAYMAPWRSEARERAFVRYETAPGEQAQMDWDHFGYWGGKRLYGFALTLSWDLADAAASRIAGSDLFEPLDQLAAVPFNGLPFVPQDADQVAARRGC